jgi:hypothetical protein
VIGPTWTVEAGDSLMAGVSGLPMVWNSLLRLGLPYVAIRIPAGNTPCTGICAHAVCDNFVTSARNDQFLESADAHEIRVNTREKVGGPGRDRTDDLFHAMEARSQLRHRPTS